MTDAIASVQSRIAQIDPRIAAKNSATDSTAQAAKLQDLVSQLAELNTLSADSTAKIDSSSVFSKLLEAKQSSAAGTSGTSTTTSALEALGGSAGLAGLLGTAAATSGSDGSTASAALMAKAAKLYGQQ